MDDGSDVLANTDLRKQSHANVSRSSNSDRESSILKRDDRSLHIEDSANRDNASGGLRLKYLMEQVKRRRTFSSPSSCSIEGLYPALRNKVASCGIHFHSKTTSCLTFKIQPKPAADYAR